MKPFCQWAVLLIIMGAWLSGPAMGAEEETVADGTAPIVREKRDFGATYRLKLTPAPEPIPAFKYRLVRPDLDIQPGNAATPYYRSVILMKAANQAVVEKYGVEFTDWARLEADEFPVEKAKEMLATFSGALDELRKATLREKCDWELNERQLAGPKIFELLLPEFQEMRQWARIMAIKTRLHTVQGDFDEAADTLRMAYQFAGDTGRPLTLVNKLVGIAQVSIANEQLIYLAAHPDAPNLYWAASELPDPIIDVSPAIRYELANPYRMFPFMRDAETAVRSKEDWARAVSDAFTTMRNLNGNGGPADWKNQVAAAGFVALSYPRAKQHLVAAGMDPDRIARLPAGQVIAIQTAKSYQYIANEIEKWSLIPFHQARSRNEQATVEALTADTPFGPELVPMAQALLPAISAARQAQIRIQRDMAAIRTIEAIRLHASATGSVPASLGEIELVPVPLNPATNEPFAYKAKDGVGFLRLPESDGITYSKNFVIRIRQP